MLDIDDIPDMRAELESRLDALDHHSLAEWAVGLASHVSFLVGPTDTTVESEGACARALAGWSAGVLDADSIRARASDLRSVAMHCDGAEQSAVRAMACSVSCMQDRADAILASDYAVRAVNLLLPDDMDAVMMERLWHILTANA